MLRLQIITVSTRPGRKGPAVASWFEQRARAHGAFEVEVVDLADVGLPLLDEPEHPRLRKYQHEHTKRWSAIVERGEAYVFVTPEYNFSAPPSLLNAIDYLYTEWAEKPAAFVSYGGVSAGLRGVQMAKQALTSVGVMPIVASVAIPMFATRIGLDGTFAADEKLDGAANAMLTDLARWATALAGMRASRG